MLFFVVLWSKKVVETGHLGQSWLYLPHEKETTVF